MKNVLYFVSALYLLLKVTNGYNVARDPWTLATTTCLDATSPYYSNLNPYDIGTSGSCTCGCGGSNGCNCGSKNCGCGCNSANSGCSCNTCSGNSGCSCGNCSGNSGCSCNSGSCSDCGSSSRVCRSCGGCGCGGCTTSCYRSLDDVCKVCEKPSPVCDCLKKCDCDLNCPIYFPEVVYPTGIMNLEPFYYGSCFTY